MSLVSRRCRPVLSSCRCPPTAPQLPSPAQVPGASAPSPSQPGPYSPSSQPDLLAGCKPGKHSHMPDPPSFGFLIAEKFIRSQTIASSKMPRENNQASSSPPAVQLPLLNGPLNGARWCLGARPGQVIDVRLEAQEDPGWPEMSSEPLLRAISAIPHPGWAARPRALTRSPSPSSTEPGLVRRLLESGEHGGCRDREGWAVPVLVGRGGIVSSLGVGGGENCL